jgi:uncharacterized repeat protein (TIGR03803 family)
MTYEGGIAPGCPGGCGTVFELTPPSTAGGPWKEKLLYSFTGQNGDGAYPTGGLVMDAKGALYGTASQVGAWGYGAVFELSPPAAAEGAWTETILYSFTGQNGDGIAPEAGVLFGPDGGLYGTTLRGGNQSVCPENYPGFGGCGTVFELTPPASAGGSWTEAILYAFAGPDGDGAFPESALVFGRNGSLYGTTYGGGTSSTYGTVFELAPPTETGGTWTEKVLHDFRGSPVDGAFPETGNLLIGGNGAIYGVTAFGGANCVDADGCGTLFELSPPAASGARKETVLHSFAGSPADGSDPAGLTFGPGGVIYGTTWAGGLQGDGTIFQMTPAGAETVEFNFTDKGGTGGGEYPGAPMIVGPKGALYGTTYEGAYSGNGTVFEWTP